MSDVSGTTPEEPVGPEGSVVPDEIGNPEESLIPPADEVIPPPPPEIPIPDGLLAPPPAEIPPADAVIPPPPPETRRRSAERRATPAVLDGEQPSAAADDWARPSVAPVEPTSGTYRGLSVVIFAVLILLLVAAIGTGIFLLTTVGLPFAGAVAGFAVTPPL
jgi:hypothetical protein